MNPVVALYLAIKRKESGKFQFVPAGGDGFGVVMVSLVDGNVIGFDSMWGTSFENVREMFKWKKAIIKKTTIGSGSSLANIYIPRQEALARIVAFEVEGMGSDVRDPYPEEARSFMRMRIGKRIHLSSDELRDIKAGKFNLKSFFLQHDMDHAAIFVAGREVYTFRLTDEGVRRIPLKSFPEIGSFMVSADHLIALTVAIPLFTEGKDLRGEEVLAEVERLKKDPTKLWHIMLSGIGDIRVSILGYRGVLIGVFVLSGDEVKVKDEKHLKSILETINLEGRLYEYGTDMRSA